MATLFSCAERAFPCVLSFHRLSSLQNRFTSTLVTRYAAAATKGLLILCIVLALTLNLSATRRTLTPAFRAASMPMTRSNVAKMIETAGDRAGLPHCHPHMLRHTAGHLLADAGHDTRRLQLWLGHSDIKHTARYSELSAKPFRDFWR